MFQNLACGPTVYQSGACSGFPVFFTTIATAMRLRLITRRHTKDRIKFRTEILFCFESSCNVKFFLTSWPFPNKNVVNCLKDAKQLQF